MGTTLSKEIQDYNDAQTVADKAICDFLANEISQHLPEANTSAGSVQAKVWHRHPVWFLDGNPVTGYSKEKKGIRLMFWSGADFEEEQLAVRGAKFKDASIFYNDVSEVNTEDLQRWLEKSINIQWDYKNIVKRKGVLERLK